MKKLILLFTILICAVSLNAQELVNSDMSFLKFLGISLPIILGILFSIYLIVRFLQMANDVAILRKHFVPNNKTSNSSSLL